MVWFIMVWPGYCMHWTILTNYYLWHAFFPQAVKCKGVFIFSLTYTHFNDNFNDFYKFY